MATVAGQPAAPGVDVALVAAKVRAAQAAGLRVMLHVGEPIAAASSSALRSSLPMATIRGIWSRWRSNAG
ncbi:hypothetical protein [Sphingomonas sp. VNH70]|uniref:hypothetical protein n=1 Tax=Sphingomonas silueang TaxID=3156617 RepID=UPI0032B37E9E